MSRHTQAVIDTSALVHNFTQLQQLNGTGKSLAVIKANAYGHGAREVVNALKAHTSLFAVAILKEALDIRQLDSDVDLLVLQGPHEPQELDVAFEKRITLALHDQEQWHWWINQPESRRPKIWLNYDTGMHRLGFQSHQIHDVIRQYKAMSNAPLTLMTHFHSADEPDISSVQTQIYAFRQIANQYKCLTSMANSPAAIQVPDSHANWNRLGISIYGSSALPESRTKKLALKPVMTLKTSIIALRQIEAGESVGYGATWRAKSKSVIATLGLGYADGYPRHMPSGAPILIGSKLCPVAGRISMDMVCVDVTKLEAPYIGQPAVLWGHGLSVDSVADYAQTISYELLTRVSPRVPRVYV